MVNLLVEVFVCVVWGVYGLWEFLFIVGFVGLFGLIFIVIGV